MAHIITWINFIILCYFIFSVTAYSLLLFSTFPEIIQFFKTYRFTNVRQLLNRKMLPPITVIMPVYNEERFILEAVSSILKSAYPNTYAILVNDGSTDQTMDLLINTFGFTKVPVVIEEKIETATVLNTYVSKTHPNLMLIDKEHNGAGDSINVGINACFTPYFMTMDADSIMHPEAITELMHYIITHPNVMAVGGGVYLLNGCLYKDGQVLDSRVPPKWISALQSNEYLRSHLFNRTAWNRFNGTMSYSGTATAFYRQTVIDAGGFDTQNYAQDAEIIIRLHQFLQKNHRPYQIGFNPAVAVWTEVPDTFKSYTIQQDHWRRGILKSVLPYWYMFFNPKYKIVGLFSYPMYVILEVLAPLVEFTAYFTVGLAYYYGLLNGTSALMYIILAWGFSSYITMANAFINLVTFNRYRHLRDVLWTFALACMDMLGFRQYLTTVKIVGTFRYLFNKLLGKPL